MRVWVTRDEDSDGPLSTALRECGIAPVLEPVLERRILSDLADELRLLAREDWLVLPSVYVIENIAEEPARVPRVGVVGQPSRRAAQARGFRVQLVSTGPGINELFRQAIPLARNHKLLCPRSSRTKLPYVPPDVTLLAPTLYETVPRKFDDSVMERVDVIAVTSPAAVKIIGEQDARFASIGPTTSAALRELEIEPWIEAPESTFESLAQAIAETTSAKVEDVE